jgi:hypothetical protein
MCQSKKFCWFWRSINWGMPGFWKEWSFLRKIRLHYSQSDWTIFGFHFQFTFIRGNVSTPTLSWILLAMLLIDKSHHSSCCPVCNTRKTCTCSKFSCNYALWELWNANLVRTLKFACIISCTFYFVICNSLVLHTVYCKKNMCIVICNLYWASKSFNHAFVWDVIFKAPG